jgi:hypothetical protein
MELGPVHAVLLAEARERAGKARLLRYDNIDPIKERKSRGAVAHAEADRVATRAKGATFREAAEAFIGAHEAAGKNAKHGRNGLVP